MNLSGILQSLLLSILFNILVVLVYIYKFFKEDRKSILFKVQTITVAIIITFSYFFYGAVFGRILRMSHHYQQLFICLIPLIFTLNNLLFAAVTFIGEKMVKNKQQELYNRISDYIYGELLEDNKNSIRKHTKIIINGNILTLERDDEFKEYVQINQDDIKEKILSKFPNFKKVIIL